MREFRTIWTMLLLCCWSAVFAQNYHIGDIYTAPDGSRGVVYFLSPDGSGGWAVALQDVSVSSYAWGNSSAVPGLANYQTYSELAMSDTAGFGNTESIRAAQNDNPFYAAGTMDFQYGWYLPSVAQLRLIYAQLPIIQNALLTAGGSVMANDFYWSSTQSSSDTAWAVNFNRTDHPCWIREFDKSSLNRVRAVHSFHFDTLACAWSTGSTQPAITVTPTQTTTYTAVAVSPNGCTDTAEVSIVVLNSDTTQFDITACDSYVWNDSVYNTTGDYVQHFVSAIGCDSVVTLHLTVNYPDEFLLADTVVENNLPYMLNGSSYDSTGVYVQHLSTVGGCDSTLTLALTVVYNVHSTADSVVCSNVLPFTWNGVVFTEAGTQSAALPAANGADSIVVMTLTLKPAPEAVINGSPFMCADSSVVLTADSAYSYLWSTGATTDSILVTEEGLYSLSVTNEYSCTDTVAFMVQLSDLDSIIAINPLEMCAGGSYVLTVGYEDYVNIQLEHGTSSLALADTIFLPDGVSCLPYGCSYRSPLTFTDFAPDATIQSVDDIFYVRLNIEHSFIGDLYINITCPNGQKADLMRYSGSGVSPCDNTVPVSSMGWHSGDNMVVSNVFGLAYDIEGANACDPNCEGNEPGIGWNYCWSNNTTQGYVYAPGAGSYIYRYQHASAFTVDSSNVAAGTQFYHPDQSFANLIGCPLNGSWYIEVVDAWSGDNGYIFGWELVLDPSLLPLSSNPVTLALADGPWIESQTDTSFVITPPDTLEHDTLVAYVIHLFDDYGCGYDTTITLPIYVPNSAAIDTTVLENDLPLVLNGQSFSAPNTYVQNLTTVHGCDSTLTVHLTVLNNVQTTVDSAICVENFPFQWNGVTFTEVGTQNVVLTAANGVDSTVIMTVSLLPSPQAVINGSPFMCPDSSLVLTAGSATSYLWSTGATTDSILVTADGLYSLSVTNEYGCMDTTAFMVQISHLDSIVAINTLEMCAGGSYVLTVGYENDANIQLEHGTSSLALAETIFLPDGVSCPPFGCSYRSPLTFTDFAPNATIQSIDDIFYVRLNIEHSFIGDLYINITCPNGQKADLLRYGGSGYSSCDNLVPTSSIGWQSGNNMSQGSYLGLAHDGEGYDDCNPNQSGNAPGIGWNYCWSNNTTEGYGYAPGAGSLIYRSQHAHNYIVDSSNVAAETQFYHPDQSFASLIGCPLNGSWYIEVVDAWSGDNGYIFGWELVLDPSLLPQSSNPVTLATADGPWIESQTDTSFVINPPDTLTHDTIATYIIHLYDDYGCSYDTTITLPIYVPTSATLDTTVLQNDLPLVLNGHSYNTPNTYVQNLTSVHGCDSTLTVNMTVLYNVHTFADSAVCVEALPLHWNGKTFNTDGSQNAILTAASGVDSTVTMTVTINPSPAAVINGSPFICADSSLVLTADSATTYSWSTGATTQSITVTNIGTYELTVTNAFGCVGMDNHIVSVTEIDPVVAINTFEMCAGDSYMLTVGYDNDATIQFAHGTSTLALAETIFLPDGVSCPPFGCSYRSPLTFTDFAPGSSIQSVNDILYVRLNIEHSWIGDLYINITCPNGQKADLLKYGGSGYSSCDNSVPTSSIGWQSGSNMSVSTYLGIAHDMEGYDDCNPNVWGNEPGVGWNYCWSNNTTQGYGYAPGAGSLIYRSVNAHNFIVDSSNVAAGTKFYHPDQSFSNLLGCPLNGSWYIEVVDAWSGDNGYIFGWELALDPSLLPQSSNPVTMATADGPWLQSATDTSFTITPPDTLDHDTVVTYIVHLYDDYGCSYDTAITLPVYVQTSSSLDITVLENDLPLVMNGQSMDTSGTYVQSLTNVHGCDSTLTINMTVLYNVQSVADSAICVESLPLHWNGKTFTTAGTQNAVLTAANGVDSTVVMTVSIIPATSSTITATVVQNNLPYTLNGTNYNSTGVYTQHLTNAAGCDSVITLNLTVYQNVSHTIDTTVCASSIPYTWHGLNFAAAGTQSVVLTASTGADSTLYCHLTVDNPVATIGNVTHVLCYGASTGAAAATVAGAQSPLTYQWTNASGASVSTTANLSNQPAGTYSLLVTDHLGCTTTATVTLNTESDTLQPGTIADDQDVCIDGDVSTFTGDVASGGDNGAYQWQMSLNGTTWNTAPGASNSQNYTYPDPAAETFLLRRAWISQNCGTAYSDTVTVTVWMSFIDTVTATVCQNEPYQGDGFDITADETADPGEYFFENLLTTGHCDSLIVLKLTVNPAYEINIEDEVCEGRPYNRYGFSIPLAETLESETIQRTANLQSMYGCDSIVNITVTVVDTALEIISSTEDFCEELYAELTAVSEMTNYMWNTGDQTQQIIVRQSGMYSVIASHGECAVTAQYNIESCEVRLYLPNAITPSNGDGINDYLSLPEQSLLLIDEFEIAIYNRWGELIYFSTDKNFQWDGTVRGQLYQDNVYNYFIRCTNVSGRPYLYKGSITVL